MRLYLQGWQPKMDKYFKDYPLEVRKNLESMPELRAKIKESNREYDLMDKLLNNARKEFTKKYPNVCPEPIIFNCIKPY